MRLNWTKEIRLWKLWMQSLGVWEWRSCEISKEINQFSNSLVPYCIFPIFFLWIIPLFLFNHQWRHYTNFCSVIKGYLTQHNFPCLLGVLRNGMATPTNILFFVRHSKKILIVFQKYLYINEYPSLKRRGISSLLLKSGREILPTYRCKIPLTLKEKV